MAGRRGPTRREEMIMTQDKAQKAAIRQRMTETGEPYSVARHAVEREREAGGEDGFGAQGGAGQARERAEQERADLARERMERARQRAEQAQERADQAQEQAEQARERAERA